MFKKLLVAGLISLSLSVPCMAAEVSVNPADVFSAITLDMNNDGSPDRAVLVKSKDDAAVDLLIYLGGSEANAFKLALNKPQIAWTGAMWGTLPSLATNNKDSLVINSENSAIGRDRWSQKLTVVYRNNQFIVAGYTTESYDTLDPKAAKSCDINLLTGKGKKDGKAIEVKVKSPALQTWQENTGTSLCK